MKILRTIPSQATQDGDGVKIARVADFAGKLLDPFLMVDELKSDDLADYIGGFPPHPHRGMETFTYIIKGGFEHQDQMGNKKVIAGGDVQWMSTGFGVVHSEMPVADAKDGMHGFQIWVNMPAKDKLRKPRYQDSTETGLPSLENNSGASLKALAGDWQLNGEEVVSPLNGLAADAAIADVTLEAGGLANVELSDRELAFLYVHTGELNGIPAGNLILVDNNHAAKLVAGEQGAGALVFKGNPLKEPIAHMGPFVMNYEGELRQAILDYQSGKFGNI